MSMLTEIRNIARLSDEETLELVCKAQQGDVDAEERLSEHKLQLVASVARKVRKPRSEEELENAITDGVFGLKAAIADYDLSSSVPFDGYAIIRIRGAILDAGRKNGDLPRGLQEVSRTLKRTEEELTSMLERKPSKLELALALEMTIEDLDRILSASSQKESLNRELVDDGGLTVLDLQPAPDCTEEDVLSSERRQVIEESLRQLPDEQRAIIEARMGWHDDNPETVKAYRARTGVSERKAREFTQNGLASLRESLSATGLFN